MVIVGNVKSGSSDLPNGLCDRSSRVKVGELTNQSGFTVAMWLYERMRVLSCTRLSKTPGARWVNWLWPKYRCSKESKYCVEKQSITIEQTHGRAFFVIVDALPGKPVQLCP